MSVRGICGGLIFTFAVVMWLGPLSLAIFDLVTWLAGFGPISNIDWGERDRIGAMMLWTFLGWLPMAPVGLIGLRLAIVEK